MESVGEKTQTRITDVCWADSPNTLSPITTKDGANQRKEEMAVIWLFSNWLFSKGYVALRKLCDRHSYESGGGIVKKKNL